MKLKFYLILMTLVAVVSDYLLHPFYPQFFEMRFGVTDPKQVGYYFGAICFMVMLAFPFWAYVSKKISELNILVFTQAIAGVLALFCYKTESYFMFWLISLVMVLFKGSYLLVYPYILKIITSKEHPSTIALLSVVVHLGGILGAVLGGVTVDYITPSSIFLIMALGDFIQMSMSVYLLKSKRFDTNAVVCNKSLGVDTKLIPKGFILKIGVITLILYFSDFLIRPFFSVYWESFAVVKSKLVSGAVYAIPGFVALIALWLNKKFQKDEGVKGILNALIIGCLGLFFQGFPNELSVVIGRVIYGWAVFQSVVKFDILLFKFSTPESYAIDYSKVNFFQNLGVLLASLFGGVLVENFGLKIPFIISIIGFALTVMLYFIIFKTAISPKNES